MKVILFIMLSFIMGSCRSMDIETGIEKDTDRRYFIIQNDYHVRVMSIRVISKCGNDYCLDWELRFVGHENEIFDGLRIYYGEPFIGKYKVYNSNKKARALLRGTKYKVIVETDSVKEPKPLEFIQ